MKHNMHILDWDEIYSGPFYKNNKNYYRNAFTLWFLSARFKKTTNRNKWYDRQYIANSKLAMYADSCERLKKGKRYAY